MAATSGASVDVADVAVPADALAVLEFLADPLAPAAASPSDAATTCDTDIYAPLQAAERAWITSAFGAEVDNAINSLFSEDLISNGANGIRGGTLAEATGGAGGFGSVMAATAPPTPPV